VATFTPRAAGRGATYALVVAAGAAWQGDGALAASFAIYSHRAMPRLLGSVPENGAKPPTQAWAASA
jgi:hypothetical protein